MNTARAFAAIQIAEAEKAARAASDPNHAHSYAIRRDQDARDKARRAAVAAMNDRYQAKRAAKKIAAAKAAALAATRGPGWQVIDRDHTELEALAKQIWDVAFHAIPFPERWRVRWGRLRASTPGAVVFGQAVRSARVIVIDATAHRTGRALVETLTHELIHAIHGPEAGHGPDFQETLRRVLAVVMPEDEVAAAPREAAPPAARPYPEPHTGPTFAARPHPQPVVTGRRWSPYGWVEKPGLERDLEYRG